jgi:hypothetical protein
MAAEAKNVWNAMQAVFGDGYSYEINEDGSGLQGYFGVDVVHFFMKPGVYNVTLTVTEFEMGK